MKTPQNYPSVFSASNYLRPFLILIILFAFSSVSNAQIGALYVVNKTKAAHGETLRYTMRVSYDQVSSGPSIFVTTDISPWSPLVAGSVNYISGPIISPTNPVTPDFQVVVPSFFAKTRVAFDVTVDPTAPLGTVIESFYTAVQSGSTTKNSPTRRTTVVESFSNGDCSCLNDGSVNNLGSYSTVLKIASGSPLLPDSIYTITSSSNVFEPDGAGSPGATGAAISGTFIFCDGTGCPTGISSGEYYKEVHVSTGNFSMSVETPMMETITISSACNLYPELPTPIGDICADATVEIPLNGGNYSLLPTFGSGLLPMGFDQTSSLLVIEPRIAVRGDTMLYYFRESSEGCMTTSLETVGVSTIVVSTINDDVLSDVQIGQSQNLNYLRTAENSGGGLFAVDGVTLNDDVFDITTGGCFEVSYTINNGICPITTSTSNLLIDLQPIPSFEITSTDSTLICQSGGTYELTVNATSTGGNQAFFVESNNSLLNGVVSGTTITLDAPTTSMSGVRYDICLAEMNDPLMACGAIGATSVPGADTTCIEFIIFDDGLGCGGNALFSDNNSLPGQVDVCEVSFNEKLTNGCSFYKLSTVPILSSQIEILESVAFSGVTDSVQVDFNVSLFGIPADLGITGGNQTIGSFPGLEAVCTAFDWSFEIPLTGIEFQPFAAFSELLGCDKTIIQFFVDILGKIVGGDGGGYLVMADTDGDGAFDYLVDKGTFPGIGSVNIPNNVKGAGKITARAVGGWVNTATDVCGSIVPNGQNFIDLLPVGFIPIVGPIISQALTSASCDFEIAWSISADSEVPVINASSPDYINCNGDGYVFAQTLDCDIPVNWSVPVAVDGATEEHLIYGGVTEDVDISNYAGTSTITPVVIQGKGIYQTAGPIPGSILPPGVYPVTYVAASSNGNPSECSFDVVVTTGDPVLECPDSLTVSTEIDVCTSTLEGLSPYRGMGCSSIINYSFTNPISGTVVSTSSILKGEHNVPDGYAFELGETVVAYTMEVDINGDGDFTDPDETQTCDLVITVVDRQLPTAVCLDQTIQLDNTGSATVFADEVVGDVFIDGGSTDNCPGDLAITISKDLVNFTESLSFDCSDEGGNVIQLRVEDLSGNVTFCKAVVTVTDFFEDFSLNFDAPEICFEPFQNSIDFSPYLSIVSGDGTNIIHSSVGSIGPDVVGNFGISGYVPDAGSSLDPGSMTPDGVYTVGEGTGWITISYVLSIDGQINQIGGGPITGCLIMAHDVIRIEKLDPIWEGGFMCCDELPVWLGGASWDGTGAPPVPAGMLSLIDIRGDYPGDVEGEWTGEGVTFVDPDGTSFTGDEFFQFDPNGLDGTFTLTYIIGDEPCIFTHSQDILVTCQDLQIALNDITVCPASEVEQRVVIVNLDDNDLVVSTTGLAAAGGVDLIDVPVVDGQVTIPSFTSVVVRNETFTIGVTTAQTTDFGCTDFFTYDITVVDTLAPVFQNCPKEPITVDAPPGWCSAFVNFEYPWSQDNCMDLGARIDQVDLSGLKSGDLFPVGTTILAYTTTDTVGNQDYCELKIIVLDYHTPPTIECPADVETVNDFDQCGAIVTDLAPVDWGDNCPDNVVIQYEITNKSGDVTACGFEDASDEFFEEGENTVKYIIRDQPLVLITEVVQDGVISGVEITNFGPADVDITCATLSMKDASGVVIEEYNITTANNKSTDTVQVDFPPIPVIWVVPNPNIIAAGDVFTHDFDNVQPAGLEVSYCFSFLDTEVDAATINGDVDGLVILRENECDHDSQDDFIPATPCNSGSYGMLNAGFTTMAPNGTTTGLQNSEPSMAMCTFKVTVDDIQAPSCMMHDTMMMSPTDLPVNFDPFTCLESVVTMPSGQVNDVNILGLNIMTLSAGEITAFLTSPEGTEIKLFERLCSGTADVNVNLDDTRITEVAPPISSAPCSPLGNGEAFKPEEAMKTFLNEEGGGDWTLELYSTIPFPSDLVSWELQIMYSVDYAQGDTIIENEEDLCQADFTWVHPVYVDNCCEGTMNVTYDFNNDVTGVSYSETDILQSIDGSINLDGTEITKTFAVGVTTISYELVDQFGNVGGCSFIVTILDAEEPKFPEGCPNASIGLDGGECYGAFAKIIDVEDNCALDSTWYCDAMGNPIDIYRLPIGANEIHLKAVDIYGNIGVCIFIVDVIEFMPDTDVLTCNNNINLSLGQDCTAEIFADMILEGGDYRCYENYCMTVESDTGTPHANIFTVDDVGQTFVVSIIDCLGGNNVCWGYVNIEEKLVPIIECPVDVELFCNEDPKARDEFTNELLTGELILLSCEPGANISFQDYLTNNGTCGDPRAEIIRRWRLEDNSGNIVFCDQVITFLPFNFDMIDWPDNFNGDDAISCYDVNLDESLTTADSTGWPTINNRNIFGDHFCDINIGFWDEILQDANCASGYEILRHWTIRNECLPLEFGTNPRVHIQSIKVGDKNAPIIIAVDDVTISTDPWDCAGTYPLPDIIHDDDCGSYTTQWFVSYGQVIQDTLYNILPGLTTVSANAIDECGNSTKTSFTITTLDQTPPVAIAKMNLVVSLTGPSSGGDGIAKIFAESVDNFSFDGCSHVRLEIRRDQDVCNFSGNTTYNANGHPEDGSSNPNSPNYDPDQGAYVKFCCEDITNATVDINDDGELDPGYVRVWLRVFDDGNMNGIAGDNDGDDNYNETWVYVKVEDKLAPSIICPPDVTLTCDNDYADLSVVGSGEAFSSCGIVNVEYNDIIVNLNTCNEGFLRRRWSVVGRSDIFCDQTITLESIDAPVNVSFAQVGDFTASGCPDNISIGEPTWIAGPCDVLGYTVVTDTFPLEDGACYKLVNHYSVINWCKYDPNNPIWNGEGLWEHIQIIKVTDETQPTIENCDDQMFEINDHSDSDDDGIFCEAKITLTNIATDLGSENCPTGWLKWQVFVDLWGDGTDDLEFSSYLPSFDNQFNDTNANGIPDKYLAPTASGETVSVALPDIEGSMSNHKVTWKVSDGCNNIRSCSSEFMVVDKKAPTPYCVDISSAVMENDGTVELWAIDFNLESFDNCSVQENLRFTFTDSQPENDLDYDVGQRSSRRIFNCEDVANSPVEVNMWVWDEKGNADFCLVYLTLNDNNEVCTGDGIRIAGSTETETGLGVDDVNITLNAMLPEYPRTVTTEGNGLFSFLNSPLSNDYQLSAEKDVDYTNGVSTLDLVLIQRHILGLESLDSPYKIIAADVNSDEKLKASDLLQLRKLILGIITEFPKNESWRFVDKTQEFDDIYDPWPFVENLSTGELQSESIQNDFIAVKIGDVNGNASANFKKASISTRSDNPWVLFSKSQQVSKGEIVEIEINSNEDADIFGYQFTLETFGLKYIDTEGELFEMREESIGVLEHGILTISHHNIDGVSVSKDDVLFKMKFKVIETGNLADMIQISSKVTASEVYTGKDLIIRDIELRFEGEENAEDIANKLYQNEPNPFNTQTSIGYKLVESGPVSITIKDGTGHIVKTINTEGSIGYNEVIIVAEDLRVSGLYYYQIKSGAFVDSKKIILVR